MKIKYAIADDHPIFRQGVIFALSTIPELKLVLESANGEELLKGIPKHSPDVILLDVKMPVLNGIQTIKEIRKNDQTIKIIIISMYEDDNNIIELMEAGANGYVLKNSEADEIIKAIFTVYETGYYFNDFVNKALLKKLIHKTHIKPLFPQKIELTNRELEVLKLICAEQTAIEISKQIFLSPRTVEGIRTRLLEKIGVKNTAGLVMYAVKNKIVE